MYIYFHQKRHDSDTYYRIPTPPYCKIEIIPRIGEKIIHEKNLLIVTDIVHEIETYNVVIHCYVQEFEKEKPTKSKNMIPLNKTTSY